LSHQRQFGSDKRPDSFFAPVFQTIDLNGFQHISGLAKQQL
jgi:hypothetical protein